MARHSAVKARTQTINAIKALLVTAPDQLREQLGGLPTTRLIHQAATLEPGMLNSPTAATMLALGGLARRYQRFGLRPVGDVAAAAAMVVGLVSVALVGPAISPAEGIKVRIARCGVESSTRLGRHRWKVERVRHEAP